MTNLERVEKFFSSENFRNIKLVDELFHNDLSLEWNSSTGFYTYNKDALIDFSKELSQNYSNSRVYIQSIFSGEKEVAIRYKYYASTIENPSEMILIANIIAIYEFSKDKIINVYQSSSVK